MPVITNPPTPQNQHVRTTYDFSSGSNGTATAHTLFTITGRIILRTITGVCTTSVDTGATGATISLGATGNATAFIGSTSATTLTTTNNVWNDTTTFAGANALPVTCQDSVVTANIIITIGTHAIADGVIVFDVWYDALTDNGVLA